MPIEVRELVIRAVVEESDTSSKGSDRTATVDPDTERQQIVQACVDQVMRILRHGQER